MSPIDDELRTALQRRATGVAPSPDPLAGIERRAGRMRRNRLAASVAGSVLAVTAVATAVPLLSGPTVPAAPPVATAPTTVPSPDPSRDVATSSYALDPAAPWPYRGAALEELGTGTVETVTREYASKRRVAEDALVLTPLWGQVFEPSGQAELVFVAVVDGEARWGVAQGSESGPEFPVDEPLPDAPLALAAALPGDEVARLVVVAAPTVGALEYGPDDASAYAAMPSLAPGVGITPLEGDPATATYRVLDTSGAELVRADVPEVAVPGGDVGTPDEPVPGQVLPPPTNVVDWPLRGTLPPDVVEAAEADAARQAGVSPEQVASRTLFGGERDGRLFGLLQVWYGGDARVLVLVKDLDDGTTTTGLLPPTAPGPAVLAAELDGILMVVPEPRTGQVLYAPDADSEPVAVPDQGTEAAVLIERTPGVTGDRLLVLDGNGDPERPIYRGTVDELLLASSS